MSAITIVSSATRTASFAGAAVDTSAYTAMKLTITAKPMPTGPGNGIRCYVDTSRDGVVWRQVSATTLTTAHTSGPDAYLSATTDLVPLLANQWTRGRVEVEAGTWVIAIDGTAV